MDLPAGGALDLTVGEYLTANGTSILGEGVKPDVRAEDNPNTPGSRRGPQPGARCRRRALSFVGVVGRRGRFLVVEPLFERGPQLSVAGGVRVRGGELVLAEPIGQRARVRAELGDPTRARDVAAALIYDRGRERGFEPGARGGREGRRPTGRRASPGAPRPDRARHVHRRPGHRAGFRRRRLGVGGRRRDPALDPHRRRRRACPPGDRTRRGGRAPRDERLRPGNGRADVAAGALGRCLQPGAGRRAARGHGRDPARRRRRGAVDPLLSQPDPLGRAARLRGAGRVLLRARRSAGADRRPARARPARGLGARRPSPDLRA